jgi:serine-type D-Ala-D-Ala carboxypeptidase (penicillin-binding protein 5/6)
MQVCRATKVPSICLEVDVRIRREHPIEVIEAPLIDRRRVIDHQLLDFDAIGDFREDNLCRLNTIDAPRLGSPPMVVCSSRRPSRMMRRFVLVAAAVVAACGLSPPAALADPVVQPVGALGVPEGPAPAWLLADMDTGHIIAARDAYVPHAPASTIKVLLALTALDEVGLGTTVVATPADTEVECNCVGIKAGRTYTARQLLDAILLVSGNDAANTLAEMLGGFDTAVAKMNAKAETVGAYDTHAASPSGLDGPGMDFRTTPHDLAVIFRAAMANPVFAMITRQPSAMFPADDGDHPIVNQDELLRRYPGALGGKTGFTNIARKTFVGAAERGGRRLIVVQMYGLEQPGGPTYWDQAAALLDWGFAQSPQATVGTL